MDTNETPTFNEEESEAIRFAAIWDHYGRPNLSNNLLLGIVATFAKFLYEIGELAYSEQKPEESD